MLLAEKFSEIFPKHINKKYFLFFISEYFVMKKYIFVALTNKKLMLPL